MATSAKSIVLDIVDNWGHSNYAGIIRVEFFLDDVRLPITSGFTAYCSGTPLRPASNAFYAKDDYFSSTSACTWMGQLNDTTYLRLQCVFDTPIEFDKIDVINFRESGNTNETVGIKNVVVTISDDAITDTTYGVAITTPTVLFDGEIPMHVASDIRDAFNIYEAPLIIPELDELNQQKKLKLIPSQISEGSTPSFPIRIESVQRVRDVRDNFVGEAGDLANYTLWHPNSEFALSGADSLQVAYDTSGYGILMSKYTIANNTMVLVKVECPNSTDGATVDDYLGLYFYIDTNNYGHVMVQGTRMHSNVKVNGSWVASVYPARTQTSGFVGLKIERRGNTLNTYIDQGSGFVLATTYSSDTLLGPVQTRLQVSDTGAHTYSFKDFYVLDGVIEWPETSGKGAGVLEYDNLGLYPPDGVNDDFTGTDGDAPDVGIWDVVMDEVNANNNIVEIRDNKLYVAYDTIGLASNKFTVTSKFLLSGDFDVQVDVDMTGTDNLSVSEYIAELYAGGGWVGAQTWSDSQEKWCGANPSYNSTTRTSTAQIGTLRLVRTGSTLVSYYREGLSGGFTSWQTNASASTDNTTVQLIGYSGATSSGDFIESTFDNLIINSGTVIWPVSSYPFEDNFNGITGDFPDLEKWSVNTDVWDGKDKDAVVTIDNNQLKIDGADSPGTCSGMVVTKHYFHDFDAQVKFDATNYQAASNYVAFYLWLDEPNRAYIAANPDTGAMKANSSVADSWVGEISNTGIDATKGTLRLVRSGNQLSTYYGIGDAEPTTLLATQTCFVGAAWLMMYADHFNDSSDYTFFSDFKVNSGLVAWMNYPERLGFDAIEVFNEITGSAPANLFLEYKDSGEHCALQVHDNLWDSVNKQAIIHATSLDMDSESFYNLYYSVDNPESPNSGTLIRPTTVDDDFTGEDGDAPDAVLWNLSYGSAVIDDNKLRLSEYGVVTSKWTATSFDVNTTFQLHSTPSDLWLIGILITFSDGTAYSMNLRRSGSTMYQAIRDDSYANLYSVGTSDTDGGLRISYDGVTVTFYYKTSGSGSWTQATTLSKSGGVAQISLRTAHWGAETSPDVSMEDFIVDSGDFTWPITEVFKCLMADDPTGLVFGGDISGDGTTSGTMTADDSVVLLTGRGLELDGTDDKVTFPYVAEHNIVDHLAIVCVFIPSVLMDSSLTSPEPLLDRGANSYGLSINTSGQLELRTTAGTMTSTKASFTAGTEYVAIVTYNSTGLVGSMFIAEVEAGVIVEEVLATDALATMTGTTEDLVIGSDGTNYFNGIIGYTAIYNEQWTVENSTSFAEFTYLSLLDQLLTWSLLEEVLPAGTLKLTLDNSAISTDQIDFPLTVQLDSTNPLHAPLFENLKQVGVDEFWDSNVITLPLNGDSGSTSFVDLTGRTATRSGNTQILTDEDAVGGSAAYFDGGSDDIHYTTSPDLYLSDHDFCIEMYFKPSTGQVLYPCLLGWRDNNTNRKTFSFLISQGLTSVDFSGSKTGGVTEEFHVGHAMTIPTDSYTHVAITREGDVLSMWINGTKVDEQIEPGAFYSNATDPLRLGAFDNPIYSNSSYKGYINQFRMTIGEARYTEDFTPPTLTLLEQEPIVPAPSSKRFKITSDTAVKSYTGNDDFTGIDGDAPNTDLWTVTYYDTKADNILVEIRDNKLYVSYDTTGVAGSKFSVATNFLLTGDFDIQVDVDLTGTDNLSVSEYIGWISAGGGWVGALTLSHTLEKWAGSNPSWGDISRSSQVGTLRLVKTGSTLVSYYRNGLSGGFSTFQTNASAGTDDTVVGLVGYSGPTSNNDFIESTFDNFVINSGTIVWPDGLPTETVDAYELPVEIENFQTDKATLHTKVPFYSSSANSELLLSWNALWEDSANVGVTGDAIAQTVWDSNFVAVYHLAQDPSGGADCILDSTSYANHGTPAGSMVVGDLVEAPVGLGLAFNGTSQYIDLGSPDVFDVTDFTVETVQNVADSVTTEGILSSYAGTDTLQHWGMRRHATTTYGLFYYDNGVSWDNVGGTVNIIDDWHYLAGTLQASVEAKIYTDGELNTTDSSAPASITPSSNMLIAKDGTGSSDYTEGTISEIRVSDIVRSADWIKLTNLSLTDGLISWSIPSDGITILAVLSQGYDLIASVAVLNQPYGLYTTIQTVLTQEWGDIFMAALSQEYGDKAELTAVLNQYYDDMGQLLAILKQPYEDRDSMMAVLNQPYVLRGLITAVLVQKYKSIEAIPPAVLRQTYDIKDTTTLNAILKQYFSLLPSSLETGDFSGTYVTDAAGTKIATISIDYDYGLDSYCGSFLLSLADEGQWKMLLPKDPFIVTVAGIDHYCLVVEKSSGQSVGTRTYSVECKSPAVLLDFPFATEVPEDFNHTGSASELVNRLAALEGLSITWEMRSNPPLTVSNVQLSGGSPLAGIRKIVNELGGRVQSHPDGSIYAKPRYRISTNMYATTIPDYSLTTGGDFVTLNTDTDKRDGYNKFSVSNESYGDEYSLETERITDSTYKVKAFRVPWDEVPVTLQTSELTNVYITAKGLTEEEVSDIVEIVDGTGSVSAPCYGNVTYVYEDRVNLGVVSISESGVVTTAITGNTLVEVTYTTRYWLWEVNDTDTEQVQFILVK